MNARNLSVCRRCIGLVVALAALYWAILPVSAQDDTGAGQAGLVIVDGSDAMQQYCVDVDTDATGWDLLVDAGVAVNSEPSGMGNTVCAINGTGCSSPRESCFCQCQGSPCVYWSYWLQTETGDWVYSNQGASNARVRPGEVQAWVWGDGTSGNAPEPPPIAFDAICTVGQGAGESLDAAASQPISVPTPNEPASPVGTAAHPGEMGVLETTSAPDVMLSPTAVLSTTAASITAASTTTEDISGVGTQNQGFPWSALLVLAPLPIILLVLLRKR